MTNRHHKDNSRSNQLFEAADTRAKPFLRWAGGKNWFLKYLQDLLPRSGYVNYHEPFIGGGSVFFWLRPNGRAFLGDLNPNLISTYEAVKRDAESVIKVLKGFRNDKESYYQLRGEEPTSVDTYEAAKFIYLNQTSFNGIYRVNQQGKYNVPYGYRTKNFLEPDKLRIASAVLNGAVLEVGDFWDSIKNVKRNDLVFLDPPYNVTHFENGFVKYNSTLFSETDQFRLATYIDQLEELGAWYILTNAKHPNVEKLYSRTSNKIITLNRQSSVGGKHAKHGLYPELVFTNISV